MGKFKRGVRRQTELTKGQIASRYDNKFDMMASALQGMQTQIFQQLGVIAKDLSDVKKQMEAIDYRTVATRDLNIDKGIFTDQQHTEHARDLRIKDFETNSAKDDELRKLVSVTRAAKLDDHVTMQITAKYPKTIEVPSIKDKTSIEMKDAKGGKDVIVTTKTVPHPQADEEIGNLSFLRSKIKLGSGQLMAELETALIGAKVGEVKTIPLTMPPQYADFADKDIVFTVDVLDVKEEPTSGATKIKEVPKTEESNGQETKEDK